MDGNPNIDIKFTVKKLVQSSVPWETNTRRASTIKVIVNLFEKSFNSMRLGNEPKPEGTSPTRLF